MKNNKREMLLTSLVCLLPLFAGAALYPRLPETMATHWDFSGNANGWSSRAATVFGLPLFILALHLVCFYAESRETKKNRNPVLRTVLLWFCPAVSLLGGAVTLGTGLGRRSGRTAPWASSCRGRCKARKIGTGPTD